MKGTTGYLHGAVVTNCSTKIFAFSNIAGEFKIDAKKGDTLTISLFNYVPDTVVIKDQKLLLVHLRDLVIDLKNVVVKGKSLSPLERYRKNQEDYKQIYRIGDMSNIISLNGNLRGSGLGLNIDALYSAFSRQGRNARRLQRTIISDYYANFVDSRFTASLVSQVTGYQGKQLEDFMISNRPSYEFMNTASDYDLIQYIKRRVSGLVLNTDNPLPKKATSGGFHIKYRPAGQSSDSRTLGTKYLPIHP